MKFQKAGTKSLIPEFSKLISMCNSYFPVSHEPHPKNSSLTSLWNANLKSKLLR